MAVGECYLCGKTGTVERHHVFGGIYRRHSEDYKEYCVVNLCPECHRYIHSSKGVETKRQMQCDIQYLAMDGNDWDLNMWLQIFGKSWI